MDSETYEQIKNLFDDYIEMYSSRNDLLTSKFSPDFSGFAGGGDVLVTDREEWIAVTRHDFSQVKEHLHIDIKDLSIQSLTEDVAIATSFFTIRLPIEDDYFSRETVRLVLIFHKREGEWKIAHSSISIPYGLVGKGEIYPLKALEEKNKSLERVISERTEELEKASFSLKDSELRYRRLFESAIDGILILDAETGMIVDVNPCLLDMLGYSKGQFINKKVWELGFLKHLIANQEYFLELQKKKYVRYEDVLLETSDGRHIDVEFVSNVYVVDYQHVIQCNIRNITDRKQAQNALIANEEKLRTLFNTMSEGIALNEILYNEKGEMVDYRVLEVNDAFYQTADFKPGQVVGNRATELYGMSPEFIKAYWRSHKHETKVEHTEMWSPINKKCYSIWTSPFANDMFVTSFVDITEQKHAEDALRQSEERYQRITNATTDYIYTVQIEGGRIAGTNHGPGCLAVTGYRANEFALDPYLWFTMVAPDDRAIVEEQARRVLTGNVPPPIEHRIIHKDGSVRWVRNTFVLHRDENGAMISYDGLVQDITDRKRAEEALQESEAKLRAMFDSSRDAIGVSKKGIYIYSNSSYLKLFGFESNEELLGSAIVESIAPSHRQQMAHNVRRRAAKESVGKFYEARAMKRNSAEFDAEFSVSTYELNGETYSVAVIRDITERKLAERQLRESESRFRALIEQAPVAINVSRDGIIIYGNRKDAEIYGLRTVDESAGRSVLQYLAPQCHEESKERTRCRSHGLPVPSEFESVGLRTDGSQFPIHVAVASVQLQDGEANIAFISDITDRKKAEELMRENNLMLELAMSAANMAWWQMDISTGNITFEKRKAEMLGFPPEQFKHYKDFMALVHPEDSERAMNAMRGHFDGSLEKYEVEYRISTKSGDYKWFYDIGAITKRDANGKPLKVAGLVINISERKRAEDALRQAQRLESLGTLAGGIAHDFNNVLGGIMGYGEMSLQYAEKGSKLEKNLHKVLKATDRAKHLIEQILTFSRKTDSRMSITSIRPIITEVLDLLRASIPSSVEIDSDLDKNTKPILADPTKLHEVILNLATNAVHAMNRKGTLTIKLFARSVEKKLYGQVGEIAPGEYSVIDVVDTGCGMDSATLARAFEPFFTTKPIGEGTGMGLSVVLGVVQAFGGDIQVQSEVGNGTRFTLYFPVVKDSVSEVGNDDSTSQLAGTERILFVDDEQMLVEMSKDMLASLGYNVTCVSNSLEALKFMREEGNNIDILIADQTMPGMSGIELAKEVLKIRKDLPIILCTGFSNELNPEKAAAIGVKNVVMKPFRIAEIGKAIRDALEKVK